MERWVSNLLTIFSSPKAFEGHIGVIQRNAIRSWLALGPDVEVLLIGDEPGMEGIESEFEITVRRDVLKNEYGTPRLDSIFSIARQQSSQPSLCYANTDLILINDLLPTVDSVSEKFEEFLILGRRWDLTVMDPLFADFDRLGEHLDTEGKLHPAAGSDYFIFPHGVLSEIPSFALGRAGWDNWMIYAARSQRIAVVDATDAITAVHQSHDYGHLPGGQPHYRMPESEYNIQLAGGREVIFTLRDANWHFRRGKLVRDPLHAGITRSLEAAVISRLGPGSLARLTRLLFHPREMLTYLGAKAKAAML